MNKSYLSQKVCEILFIKHKDNELVRITLMGFNRGVVHFQIEAMPEVEIFCEEMNDD